MISHKVAWRQYVWSMVDLDISGSTYLTCASQNDHIWSLNMVDSETRRLTAQYVRGGQRRMATGLNSIQKSYKIEGGKGKMNRKDTEVEHDI